MAYGFSVYWLPMSQLIGEASPFNAPSICRSGSSCLPAIATGKSPCSADLHAVFVFLGCSAALWGSWLEKVGPRLVSFIATLCWCGGLLLSSVAIYFHQLWLLWLGAGVIGNRSRTGLYFTGFDAVALVP